MNTASKGDLILAKRGWLQIIWDMSGITSLKGLITERLSLSDINLFISFRQAKEMNNKI
jgi:hypothetical protein